MNDKPKLDLTKPVQTRDGMPARILCADAKGDYPIFGARSEIDGREWPSSWTRDGKYNSTWDEHPHDLINVPPKTFSHKRWVNVFPDGSVGVPRTSKQDCDRLKPNRVACVEITIAGAEGDGL